MRTSRDAVVRALGWFSLATGTPQVLVPHLVCRTAGVHETGRTRAIVRGVGVRELVTGAGILNRPTGRAGWMWARVVGDAQDLVLLAATLRSGRTRKGRVALAMATVATFTAVDVVTTLGVSRRSSPFPNLGRSTPL